MEVSLQKCYPDFPLSKGDILSTFKGFRSLGQRLLEEALTQCAWYVTLTGLLQTTVTVCLVRNSYWTLTGNSVSGR